jgi:hypothetical protein
MAQIVKKFIGDNQVSDEKVRLDNADYLRARNAANSGDVNIIRVNSSDVREIAGDLSMVSNKIINLATPTNAADAATKDYVDSVAGGSSVAKAAVRVVSLSNLDLDGAETVDGISLSNNDRILVAGQTAPAENGIYIVNTAAPWARASDADAVSEFPIGAMIIVREGDTYEQTLWYQSSAQPSTLGTDPITYGRETRLANKESLTLNGTDITNQYKDLAFEAKPDSLLLVVSGVVQSEGDDYTLSIVSDVTRITFAGDLATAGASALISGDVLKVQYQY